jgi:predicted RND superfamily exporter protein
MKVIAKKKMGPAWIFGTIGFLGFLAFISSFFHGDETIIMALIGIFLCVLNVVLFVQALTMPKDIISVDEESGRIYLHPDDVNISAASVCDVTFYRGRMRWSLFKWGTVIIETPNETYRYPFVADCEEVTKNLLRLVYMKKYN